MILFTGGAGGGAGSDECTASAAEVLAPQCGGGTAITKESDDEPITGTLVLNGDATAAYVAAGKTFYNKTDELITGTLTINSSV